MSLIAAKTVFSALTLILTTSVFAFGGARSGHQSSLPQAIDGVDSFSVYFGGKNQVDIRFLCDDPNASPTFGVCTCNTGYQSEENEDKKPVCVINACYGVNTYDGCRVCTSVNGIAHYDYPKFCNNGSGKCVRNPDYSYYCEEICPPRECYTCQKTEEGVPILDEHDNPIYEPTTGNTCGLGGNFICNNGNCENPCTEDYVQGPCIGAWLPEKGQCIAEYKSRNGHLCSEDNTLKTCQNGKCLCSNHYGVYTPTELSYYSHYEACEDERGTLYRITGCDKDIYSSLNIPASKYTYRSCTDASGTYYQITGCISDYHLSENQLNTTVYTYDDCTHNNDKHYKLTGCKNTNKVLDSSGNCVCGNTNGTTPSSAMECPTGANFDSETTCACVCDVSIYTGTIQPDDAKYAYDTCTDNNGAHYNILGCQSGYHFEGSNCIADCTTNTDCTDGWMCDPNDHWCKDPCQDGLTRPTNTCSPYWEAVAGECKLQYANPGTSCGVNMVCNGEGICNCSSGFEKVGDQCLPLCPSGLERDETNHTCTICTNGNPYIQYNEKPCEYEGNITGCKDNSNCEPGQFCNLSSSSSNCHVPDSGQCQALDNGTNYDYTASSSTTKQLLRSSDKMTWWSAFNWCQAHNATIVSLEDTGIYIDFLGDYFKEHNGQCYGDGPEKCNDIAVNWNYLNSLFTDMRTDYKSWWTTDGNGCGAYDVTIQNKEVFGSDRSENTNYALCKVIGTTDKCANKTCTACHKCNTNTGDCDVDDTNNNGACNGTCLNGTCYSTTPTSCATDDDCDGGSCVNGICVSSSTITACTTNNQCTGGASCISGYCIKSCTQNSDCGDDQLCTDISGIKICLSESYATIITGNTTTPTTTGCNPSNLESCTPTECATLNSQIQEQLASSGQTEISISYTFTGDKCQLSIN